MPLESESYAIEIDDDHRLIRVNVGGFWSINFAQRYVDEFTLAITECRRRHGRMRAFHDLRGAPALSQEAGRILASLDSAFRDEDRVAMIVDSSLMKMQINRIAKFPGLKAFTAPEAAWAWVAY